MGTMRDVDSWEVKDAEGLVMEDTNWSAPE